MQNNIIKYRIESARLKNWDYSTAWWYYVTINTKNHIEWFGIVENKKMYLNDIGKIVEKFWQEIPQHYNSVELDYFIIMPNHLHGIIILNNPDVETPYKASLQQKQPPTLGIVINGFKGAVTRWCNKNGYSNFKWQSRFYDRIIRNDMELYKIRNYIEQNPLRWELDKNLPDNLEL